MVVVTLSDGKAPKATIETKSSGKNPNFYNANRGAFGYYSIF